MKNKIWIACVAILGCNALTAQHHDTVRVEYEKRTNLHKAIEGMGDRANEFKKMIPKIKVQKTELICMNQKSIYKGIPDEKNNANPMMAMLTLPQETVYNDYANGTTVIEKEMFEQTFLIQDTMHKIQWKIGEEMREFNGYMCRKAVGILFDSITIYAYYTEQILADGGPESIHGLPGLILAMQIPDMNVTWIATKVELNSTRTAEIVAPKKGDKTTFSGLRNTIEGTMGKWGNRMKKMINAFLI